MPRYKVKAFDGKTLTINAPDEAALDDAMRDYEAEHDVRPFGSLAEQEVEGQNLKSSLSELVDNLTPVGSVKEIAGQLSGDRAPSSMKAGLAAADIASLGLAGKLRAGVGLGEMGMTGVKQAFAAGAGAGAARLGAEKLGAPGWLQLVAGLGGGMAGGRLGGPPEMAMKAVPQGEEGAALGRAAQKMGLPVPPIISNKPREVMGAFGVAKKTAGEAVGAAKKAALQTEAPTAQVVKKSLYGINRGLEQAGVPVGEKGFQPEFSVEPAGAKLLQEQAAKVQSIPSDTDPNEAMQLSNNILEATKKMLADSKKTGTGQAGRTANLAVQEWQSAIDSLGPADKVAAAKAADKIFSKLSALSKVTEKASMTKTGIEPSLSPREMVYQWERMPENMRGRFEANEQAFMDAMLQQKPGMMQKAIQGVVEFAKRKGLKGISFHPTARFYEEAPRVLGPQAVALGTEAAITSPNKAAERARKLAGAK